MGNPWHEVYGSFISAPPSVSNLNSPSLTENVAKEQDEAQFPGPIEQLFHAKAKAIFPKNTFNLPS